MFLWPDKSAVIHITVHYSDMEWKEDHCHYNGPISTAKPECIALRSVRGDMGCNPDICRHRIQWGGWGGGVIGRRELGAAGEFGGRWTAMNWGGQEWKGGGVEKKPRSTTLKGSVYVWESYWSLREGAGKEWKWRKGERETTESDEEDFAASCVAASSSTCVFLKSGTRYYLKITSKITLKCFSPLV